MNIKLTFRRVALGYDNYLWRTKLPDGRVIDACSALLRVLGLPIAQPDFSVYVSDKEKNNTKKITLIRHASAVVKVSYEEQESYHYAPWLTDLFLQNDRKAVLYIKVAPASICFEFLVLPCTDTDYVTSGTGCPMYFCYMLATLCPSTSARRINRKSLRVTVTNYKRRGSWLFHATIKDKIVCLHRAGREIVLHSSVSDYLTRSPTADVHSLNCYLSSPVSKLKPIYVKVEKA